MTIRSVIPWQERVRDKQSRILAGVPSEYVQPDLSFSETDPSSVQDVPSKLLSSLELTITALKAEELTSAISAGTYTSVQVLDAFTHRAVIAHQLLHCALDFLYPRARATAEELDKYFAETGG